MRIALGGPESSGKTALAIALAQHFGGSYVPEFARFYLNRLQRPYTEEDLHRIFQGQLTWWHFAAAAADAGSFLFQDSDPSIHKVWELERYGRSHEGIEQFMQQSPFDLVLVCLPDLPWEYDPQRESQGDRDRLLERYLHELDAWKHPYRTISGIGDSRLKNALAAIDGFLTGK